MILFPGIIHSKMADNVFKVNRRKKTGYQFTAIYLNEGGPDENIT